MTGTQITNLSSPLSGIR